MSKKVIKKSKVIVKTSIYNNPKNINKSKLINFDPDFTSAYAGSSGTGTETGTGTGTDLS